MKTWMALSLVAAATLGAAVLAAGTDGKTATATGDFNHRWPATIRADRPAPVADPTAQLNHRWPAPSGAVVEAALDPADGPVTALRAARMN